MPSRNKITAVILTYNEQVHVSRCIKSIAPIVDRVVIVDSYSSDKTKELSTNLGGDFYQNAFVNQAQQFQWAMDNCNIQTEWVMRLDADEYIDGELTRSILDFVASADGDCNGAILNRRHVFLGKWVRFGGRYPLPMLRLFRKGTAHIEQKWMDEHIVLDSGYSVELKGGFYDDNLNSVSWFIDKHNKYATREMIDIMLRKIHSASDSTMTPNTGLKIRLKRLLKERVYQRLPYFLRPL